VIRKLALIGSLFMIDNGCVNKPVDRRVGVLVDPEILRAFAGQVDTAAATITAADIGSKTSSAADGLPGSTTQWAVRTVGEHFSQLAGQLAQNVAKMGQAVRGAGDKFEVADDALASQFDGLF
jgi:hypothetical protein